ncbi:DUF1345 domain-containing protein [Pedobacter sp. Du54]|uniref:DUF1345 domain-containing protein n=1 Tax=Pedobacter anseongensis TaxID=3133439 RepID=UPI0030AC2484
MKSKKNRLTDKINLMDAHHKLYVSLGISITAFAVCYGRMELETHLMITWLAYLLSSLVLGWITILSSHPSEVRHEAHAQDSSRSLVFLFVVVAAFASLFAILLLLKGFAGENGLAISVLLPLAAVIGSWWLVHTVFTLRYAHFYYCDIDNDVKGGSQKPGGLEFPAEKEPDYLDFAYFSFVVGMTFQVSDVQITSRRIRRLVWMHGLLSFAFNTFIVAFAINVVSGLISK